MQAVTYDKDSGLVYIHLLHPKESRNVRSEELKVNDGILLDIGQNGKIAGFECFGEAALLCAPFAGKSRLYVKDADGYHFVFVNRLQSVPAIQCTVSLFVCQMAAIRNLPVLTLTNRCITVRFCSA